MSIASEPFASRRDTFIFLLCLVTGAAARAAPPEFTQPIASGIRRTLLAPFLVLQQRMEVARLGRSEFDRVVAERDSAVMLTTQLDALRQENQRLRSILSLRSRLPVDHVAGEVLHQAYPTDAFTLLLAVDETKDVEQWAPVIAPGGLVGHVQAVEAGTAVALSWAHPEFRASATGLEGAVAGIVAPRGGGDGSMLLELRGVPYRVEVPRGTVITTSGLGGVYPRGIPIGWIADVAGEREGWSRTYLVEPAVHPASVSHVLILLMDVPDLSHVFAAVGQ